jgi:hypothetical protein
MGMNISKKDRGLAGNPSFKLHSECLTSVSRIPHGHLSFSFKTYFMFDQILQLVKESLENHPAIAGNIPPEQADSIHREIASHINNGLQNPPASDAPQGGILSQLESSLGSGNILTSAVSGGLVGSLASKFGLPPAITGAIAASLPGLMQKFMHKSEEPAAPAAAATV